MKSLTADDGRGAAGPIPGVGGIESAALGLRNPSPDVEPKPSSLAPVPSTQGGGNGQCEAINTGKDRKGRAIRGQRCKGRRTLMYFQPDGTTTTARCRHHRDQLTAVKDSPHGEQALAMPSTDLRTKAAAEKFMRWLLNATYRGTIANAKQADTMLKVVRSWSVLRARMDDNLVDLYRDLNRAAVRLYRLVRDWSPEMTKQADAYNALLRQMRELTYLWEASSDEAGAAGRKRRKRIERDEKELDALEAKAAARADADYDDERHDDGSDD